jgi:hypothetical protein
MFCSYDIILYVNLLYDRPLYKIWISLSPFDSESHTQCLTQAYLLQNYDATKFTFSSLDMYVESVNTVFLQTVKDRILRYISAVVFCSPGDCKMFMVEAAITWRYIIAGSTCKPVPVNVPSSAYDPDYNLNVQQYME